MKTKRPTRVGAVQMLEPLEPSYRRPGFGEIIDLRESMSAIPAERERRDRLLESLEDTAIIGKLWSDAMAANGSNANYSQRTAGALLAIVMQGLIERERDRRIDALGEDRRRDGTVVPTLIARSNELASDSRIGLAPSGLRPEWMRSIDTFQRHVADQLACVVSSS